MTAKRLICWFSCGAASAVATYLALKKNRQTKQFDELKIVYTHVMEEHHDNYRFLCDCEKWFEQSIEILENQKFNGSIVRVFDSLKYMGGVRGAPCTRLLKKEIRRQFERPEDVQVLGYTVEELERVNRFIDANNDVHVWPILIEEGLTKEDCLAILQRVGIVIPVMYKLGYRNNNCIGCVKGGAGYWNKIRDDFPDIFKQRCEQSRQIGARLIKNSQGERIFLDELPRGFGHYPSEPNFQCGIMCELEAKMIKEEQTKCE